MPRASPGERQRSAVKWSFPTVTPRGEDDRGAGEDPNYEAYLREAPELEAKYRGYMVAYTGGARVAAGKNAKELASNIPAQYRGRSIFIQDVPPKPVRFRRRLRVIH